MNKEKEIYVYADFLDHHCEPVGTIYVSESRGRETYAFEYESSWLKQSDQFLDPDLQLYAGARQKHVFIDRLVLEDETAVATSADHYCFRNDACESERIISRHIADRKSVV